MRMTSRSLSPRIGRECVKGLDVLPRGTDRVRVLVWCRVGGDKV